MASASVTVLPPVIAISVPSGRWAWISRFSRALEVAGLDLGLDVGPCLRDVRAVARAPDVAGLGAVCVAGEVAHLLEGVAAVAEVLGAVGQQLQLGGLHLGAVLRVLEITHVGRDAMDAPVEAVHLRVQHVDEAPHQRLALVGELRALEGDAVDDDADGLGQGLEAVVLVPDDAAVHFVALGRAAEGGEVLLASYSPISTLYSGAGRGEPEVGTKKGPR